MKKFLVMLMIMLFCAVASSPPICAKSVTTSAPLNHPGFDQAVVNAVSPNARMVLAVPWQNQLQFNYAPPIIALNICANAYFNDTGTMMTSDNSHSIAATAGQHIMPPDKMQDNTAIIGTDKPEYIQKE